MYPHVQVVWGLATVSSFSTARDNLLPPKPVLHIPKRMCREDAYPPVIHRSVFQLSEALRLFGAILSRRKDGQNGHHGHAAHRIR